MDIPSQLESQDDGVKYDSHGRMQYNPEFHPNNGKPFSQSDLEYMCKYYDIDDSRTLAFALGRTEKTIRQKVSLLKKQGLYEFYRNLGRNW